MATGKYLSLEEARKATKFDRSSYWYSTSPTRVFDSTLYLMIYKGKSEHTCSALLVANLGEHWVPFRFELVQTVAPFRCLALTNGPCHGSVLVPSLVRWPMALLVFSRTCSISNHWYITNPVRSVVMSNTKNLRYLRAAAIGVHHKILNALFRDAHLWCNSPAHPQQLPRSTRSSRVSHP